MPEDVIGKLESFTPSAVDRDALLFAAGRSSVKPSSGWKRLAGALAVTQAITLGLWFVPNQQPKLEPTTFVVPPNDVEEPPIPVADPYSLLALRRNPEPLSAAPDSQNPLRPPLLAFTRDYQP
ncbi:MAG: hypothetical protein KF873_08430 [Gemmataceae bacterium]|nr:hypothetical protein [Gemmataceae bacterium]